MRFQRRAFTLTEVLIAAGILSVLLVGLLQMFSVTQRQAITSESLMSMGVLAQVVSERLRANVEANPRYLRDLTGGAPTWTFTGTVVDPASAVSSELKLSPFFQNLLTRQSPDLHAPANRISIASAAAVTPTGYQPAQLASLVQTFRDFHVTVSIENDVPLDAAAPPAYAEILKVVRITIARSSVVKARGADPLAFTVTTRLVTPADALSAAALDAIYANFEGPSLEDLWTDTFLAAASNPFLQAPQLGLEARRLLADAFLVLAGANTESLQVTGECVPNSVVIDAIAGARYIDPWILELSAPDSVGFSAAKQELAALHRRKATVLFDTFKKIRLPLEHLCDGVLGPLLERVRALREKLETDLTAATELQQKMAQALADFKAKEAQIAQLSAGVTPTATTTTGTTPTTDPLAAHREELRKLNEQYAALLEHAQVAADADTETVVLASFLQQFYTDANYAPVATRPARYAERLRATLDDLGTTLARHLDMPSGVTPLDRMRAAQSFVETTMIRQLESGAADAAAHARIRALATQLASREGELAAYLQGGEVYDVAKLRERNTRFAQRVADLKRLAPRYQQVIALLQPGGEIAEFLKLHGSMFGEGSKLDASKLVADLNGVLEGSGRSGGGKGKKD